MPPKHTRGSSSDSSSDDGFNELFSRLGLGGAGGPGGGARASTLAKKDTTLPSGRIVRTISGAGGNREKLLDDGKGAVEGGEDRTDHSAVPQQQRPRISQQHQPLRRLLAAVADTDSDSSSSSSASKRKRQKAKDEEAPQRNTFSEETQQQLAVHETNAASSPVRRAPLPPFPSAQVATVAAAAAAASASNSSVPPPPQLFTAGTAHPPASPQEKMRDDHVKSTQQSQSPTAQKKQQPDDPKQSSPTKSSSPLREPLPVSSVRRGSPEISPSPQPIRRMPRGRGRVGGKVQQGEGNARERQDDSDEESDGDHHSNKRSPSAANPNTHTHTYYGEGGESGGRNYFSRDKVERAWSNDSDTKGRPVGVESPTYGTPRAEKKDRKTNEQRTSAAIRLGGANNAPAAGRRGIADLALGYSDSDSDSDIDIDNYRHDHGVASKPQIVTRGEHRLGGDQKGEPNVPKKTENRNGTDASGSKQNEQLHHNNRHPLSALSPEVALQLEKEIQKKIEESRSVGRERERGLPSPHSPSSPSNRDGSHNNDRPLAVERLSVSPTREVRGGKEGTADARRSFPSPSGSGSPRSTLSAERRATESAAVSGIRYNFEIKAEEGGKEHGNPNGEQKKKSNVIKNTQNANNSTKLISGGSPRFFDPYASDRDASDDEKNDEAEEEEEAHRRRRKVEEANRQRKEEEHHFKQRVASPLRSTPAPMTVKGSPLHSDGKGPLLPRSPRRQTVGSPTLSADKRAKGGGGSENLPHTNNNKYTHKDDDTKVVSESESEEEGNEGSSIPLPATIGQYTLIRCVESQRETILVPRRTHGTADETQYIQNQNKEADEKGRLGGNRSSAATAQQSKNAAVLPLSRSFPNSPQRRTPFGVGGDDELFRARHQTVLVPETVVTCEKFVALRRSTCAEAPPSRQIANENSKKNTAPEAKSLDNPFAQNATTIGEKDDGALNAKTPKNGGRRREKVWLAMYSLNALKGDPMARFAIERDVTTRRHLTLNNNYNYNKKHHPHPHIVGLDSCFATTRGDLVIASEYCEGGELYEAIAQHRSAAIENEENEIGGDVPHFLRGGGLPLMLAARLFVELMQAVHHIHSNGIAHRNIKLENLLLTKKNHESLTLLGGNARLPSSLVPLARQSLKLNHFDLAVACDEDDGDVGITATNALGIENSRGPRLYQSESRGGKGMAHQQLEDDEDLYPPPLVNLTDEDIIAHDKGENEKLIQSATGNTKIQKKTSEIRILYKNGQGMAAGDGFRNETANNNYYRADCGEKRYSTCCGSKHYSAPEVLLLGLGKDEREEVVGILNAKVNTHTNKELAGGPLQQRSELPRHGPNISASSSYAVPSSINVSLTDENTLQISAISLDNTNLTTIRKGAYTVGSGASPRRNSVNKNGNVGSTVPSADVGAGGAAAIYTFSKTYDPRPADIWSCGVVLFTLLTGSLPFDGVPSMAAGAHQAASSSSSVNSSADDGIKQQEDERKQRNQQRVMEETELLFQVLFSEDHLLSSEAFEIMATMLQRPQSKGKGGGEQEKKRENRRESSASSPSSSSVPSMPEYRDAAALLLAMLHRDPSKRPTASSIFRSRFVVGYLRAL